MKRVTDNKGKRTSGVDHVLWSTPQSKLKAIASLQRQGYRPLPLRRVYIAKSNGKLRPLSIPTVEDRLLQRAVARLLEAVFEVNFLECSYGFRPGRSPHGALRALRGIIVTKTVGHLFEADIRGYFKHIQHDWLQKMVAHRIADPLTRTNRRRVHA